jgi:glyoxylase-like metal-dependent hydrolase (beta-lactamase superfamily II)
MCRVTGPKLSLLDLGRMNVDDGFFIRGCNAATQSAPHPHYERRRVVIGAAVIEHPTAGPILFDTGCVQDTQDKWPGPVRNLFTMSPYGEEHHLDKALEAAGYSIAEIQAVVLSHLHLDHAGGLEHFRGRNIPVYAHEQEIKQHYYAIATKEDFGAYLPSDLHWELNWQPIQHDEVELFDGITIRHMPGHTPGHLTMQVATRNSGHFMLTADLYHIRDLFEHDLPPGWLGRDSHRWYRSHRWMKQLQKRYAATMVYGHDTTVLDALNAQATQFD